MRILFDQGTPVPLRKALAPHEVVTAFEQGWSELSNGELLSAAEMAFDVMVTTDKNLRYQQNLEGRKLAIVILPTTKWPVIRNHVEAIRAAVEACGAGSYQELRFI